MSFADWIFEISLASCLFYLFVLLVVFSSVVNLFVYRRPIKDWRNKHVVITGGSAGLGKSLASKLSALGAKVTIIARNQQKLDQAKVEIEKATNAKVVALSGDVTSSQDVESVLKQAVNAQGEIDVLIANAGSSYPSYFLDTPVEVYEREVKLNYLGTLYTVKSVLPAMVKRDKGHIVIVSSAIAYNTFIGYANYSATKFALKGLADALRNELILYNIGVTIFCPANIDTEGFKEEQKTKPKETKEIEGTASTQHPDQTADYLINGLQKGTYDITNEFFPSGFMRSMATPLFVPRESHLRDIFIVPLFVVLSPIFNIIYDGIVKQSRKQLLDQKGRKKTQ